MDSSSNLVSVCIPVYNGYKYLVNCLESVISQTYTNIEILLVDDGSTDGSLALLDQYKAKDKRVRIERNEKNLGLVGNWNKCISSAKGEWIKFLFQDDTIHPDCVTKMVNGCLETHSDFAVCGRNIAVHEDSGTFLKEFFAHHLIRLENTYSHQQIIHPNELADLAAKNLFNNFIGEPITFLFKKEIVARIGNYNKDLVQLVDYEFVLRAGLSKGFVFLPEQLVTFRVHDSSATSNRNSTDAKAIKNNFLEPLLLYHEYLFNKNFRKVRGNIGLVKLIRQAAFFYAYNKTRYKLPITLKQYIFKKYSGLKIIALFSYYYTLKIRK